MDLDLQLIAILLAILGQYAIMFAVYRDLQMIQTEFSLCKYHRSVTQIGDALRNGEKIWKDD